MVIGCQESTRPDSPRIRETKSRVVISAGPPLSLRLERFFPYIQSPIQKIPRFRGILAVRLL
jgi:hypothetical protein